MNATPKSIPVEFYQSLGKLFYAISAADKVVRPAEINSLKEFVAKEWVPLKDEVDQFGSDTAFQIETVFEWLDEEITTASAAYNDFKNYYQEHKTLFSPQLKTKIRKTADAIASSFCGKNKSELTMLANLHLLFQE